MCIKALKWPGLLLTIGLGCMLFLNTPALAGEKPDFGVLKGRWFRTDGSYVIEIRSVDAGGRMEAAYFNPNPINVSRAEASRSGTAIRVFVELRAVGYPGSTYTLVHDPRSDELKGIYHHAGLQQNFEVVFVRGK